MVDALTIDRKKLFEQVAAHLERQILDGALRPGQFVRVVLQHAHCAGHLVGMPHVIVVTNREELGASAWLAEKPEVALHHADVVTSYEVNAIVTASEIPNDLGRAIL